MPVELTQLQAEKAFGNHELLGGAFWGNYAHLSGNSGKHREFAAARKFMGWHTVVTHWFAVGYPLIASKW
jgi:hypothetical protein